MLIDKQRKSKQIVYHPDYDKEKRRINFWRSSYKSGADYIDCKDARGYPLLPKFRCEEPRDYTYRKRMTKIRNHSGSIINKMIGYVFRKEPERSESNPRYLDFKRNASLSNQTLDQVMYESALEASITGKSFLVADHTNTKAESKTLAQARAENDRPFIRVVKAESVVNWAENDGILTEAVIMYMNEEGHSFLRFYTDDTITDVTLDEDENVLSFGEEITHGYESIPIHLHRLNISTDSQIEPLAELQQELACWLSLLAVEGTKSIYTIHAFTGTLPPESRNDDGSSASIKPTFASGTSNIIYLGEEGMLHRVGAEVSAGTLLLEVIQKVEEAIYRQAGIAAGNPLSTNQPQSGLSKIFDQKDLGSVLFMLAKAAESAENAIVALIFKAENIEVLKSSYETEFDIPDYGVELSTLEQTINLRIPNVIKRQSIQDIKTRFFELDDEEEEDFKQHLLMLYPEDDSGQIDSNTETDRDGVSISE